MPITDTPIRNDRDIIDSRDVIERVKELEGMIEAAFEDYSAAFADDPLCTGTQLDLESFKKEMRKGGLEYPDGFTEVLDEECSELEALTKLTEEYRGDDDWEDGATLIHEDYFRDYAQQLADDLGMTEKTDHWPFNHIDWDAAAEELKNDYGEVDFEGVTYYTRY